MTTFKLQHPQDLISRLFILEYVKDLGTDIITDKLSEGEMKFWCYKFENDKGLVAYDFNWEYLLFNIPIDNLSKIMERYLEEIEKIDEKKKAQIKAETDRLVKERIKEPVEINLMDYAKARIEEMNKESKLSHGS